MRLTAVLFMVFLVNPVLGTTGPMFFPFPELPAIGKTAAGEAITLGGFSGLCFEGTDARTGKLRFITLTDRGPNAEPVDTDGDGIEERPFALPNYQPQMVRFELDPVSRRLTVTGRVGLVLADGRPMSGRPNGAIPGVDGEIGVDLKGKRIPVDPWGGDLEGIARAEDGSYWIGDEYGPSLLHVSSRGKVVERLVPEGYLPGAGTPVLPRIFLRRVANRGFEGVAYHDGKVYGFLQSPLRGEKGAAGIIRILEWDTRSRKVTGQYLHRLDGGGVDKVGDAVAVGKGEFLIVERDGRKGKAALKHIYRIQLDGATNIQEVRWTKLSGDTAVDAMADEALAGLGVRLTSKERLLDLSTAGYDFVEKVEGLAYIGPDRIAVLNDNDFGLEGGIRPATGKLVPNAAPELPVLGLLPLPVLPMPTIASRPLPH